MPCVEAAQTLTRTNLARPESGAASTLMLEYQKSRRRRTALGLDGGMGVRCVERNASLNLLRRAREEADDHRRPLTARGG
jgi:hypothetical protein